VVWHWVDGSHGTIAASLHRDVESSYTVDCPLHGTSKSPPYCHCHAVSMSCTHLMHCLLRVPGEAMMSLVSGALGMHGHASEAERHGTRGDARALPHREAGLEPWDT
jgi:hypothetical protein